MARSRENKIELAAYDDLFQTDESREEAKLSMRTTMAGNQHRVTLRRLLCSLCLCQHSWCQVSFPMNLVGNQIPYFSQQNTEGIGEREQRSWQDLSWYQLFTLL